jgi:uncharacterized protein
MKRSTHNLTGEKKAQLKVISRLIVSIAKPEKIILFGIFAPQESSINLLEILPALQVFDLMVIVQKANSKDLANLQPLLEEKCSIHAPVSISLNNLEYVNARLLQGNYFFSQIHEHGILIYSNTKTPLILPSPADFRKARQKAEQDFEYWSTQAVHFYSCARYSNDYGHNRACIFLLHQAAEQMYQAILLTHTGYKPTTHNLNKLRRATAKFSSKLCQVFPDKTDYDCRLFHFLVTSYADARYTEGYDIAEDDLAAIIDRIGRFLTLGQTICRLHLNLLQQLSLQQQTVHNTSESGDTMLLTTQDFPLTINQ